MTRREREREREKQRERGREAEREAERERERERWERQGREAEREAERERELGEGGRDERERESVLNELQSFSFFCLCFTELVKLCEVGRGDGEPSEFCHPIAPVHLGLDGLESQRF